jgi:hypothetical protein
VAYDLGVAGFKNKGGGKTVSDKEYIGDGVYVQKDDYMLKLTTTREVGTHVIYLEPVVFHNLLLYAKAIGFWAPDESGKN